MLFLGILEARSLDAAVAELADLKYQTNVVYEQEIARLRKETQAAKEESKRMQHEVQQLRERLHAQMIQQGANTRIVSRDFGAGMQRVTGIVLPFISYTHLLIQIVIYRS
jgi:regulator of replication initiation timing